MCTVMPTAGNLHSCRLTVPFLPAVRILGGWFSLAVYRNIGTLAYRPASLRSRYVRDTRLVPSFHLRQTLRKEFQVEPSRVGLSGIGDAVMGGDPLDRIRFLQADAELPCRVPLLRRDNLVAVVQVRKGDPDRIPVYVRTFGAHRLASVPRLPSGGDALGNFTVPFDDVVVGRHDALQLHIPNRTQRRLASRSVQNDGVYLDALRSSRTFQPVFEDG